MSKRQRQPVPTPTTQSTLPSIMLFEPNAVIIVIHHELQVRVFWTNRAPVHEALKGSRHIPFFGDHLEAITHHPIGGLDVTT